MASQTVSGAVLYYEEQGSGPPGEARIGAQVASDASARGTMRSAGGLVDPSS
jgi:hypothetical protein